MSPNHEELMTTFPEGRSLATTNYIILVYVHEFYWMGPHLALGWY